MRKTYRLIEGQFGVATVFVTLDDEPAAGDVLEATPWGRVTVQQIGPAAGSTYEADLTVSRG